MQSSDVSNEFSARLDSQMVGISEDDGALQIVHQLVQRDSFQTRFGPYRHEHGGGDRFGGFGLIRPS